MSADAKHHNFCYALQSFTGATNCTSPVLTRSTKIMLTTHSRIVEAILVMAVKLLRSFLASNNSTLPLLCQSSAGFFMDSCNETCGFRGSFSAIYRKIPIARVVSSSISSTFCQSFGDSSDKLNCKNMRPPSHECGAKASGLQAHHSRAALLE